jgi:AcrR family transcriptional regulator
VETSLRERKRLRTRRALVDAAAELFDSKGYDETTVAEIAAAAEVSTRTFFSYFASKEEILFPDSESRVQASLAAIAARGSADRPADVLLRALEHIFETDTDMVGRMAEIRTRLMLTVPAVRGRGLQIQLAAQQEIARHLHAAYPGELDAVTAAALVGAMVGAISGALLAMLDDPKGLTGSPEQARKRLFQAARAGMRAWTE